MSEELVKLRERLQSGSLVERIKKPEPVVKKSVLLIDCSYSMTGPAPGGVRKVDAMRTVVKTLRQSHDGVPLVGFGTRGEAVKRLDEIPEPSGGTPMASGIKFVTRMGGIDHIVLISDGASTEPQGDVLEAAGAFGHQIDTFFIGMPGDPGQAFLAELAKATGGSSGVTDLGKPKELAGKILLLIGDGGAPHKPGAIQL